jgi:hypothetical protein
VVVRGRGLDSPVWACLKRLFTCRPTKTLKRFLDLTVVVRQSTTELLTAGMRILGSVSTYGLIEGMLPIAQLPTAEQLTQTSSVTAMLETIPAFAV